MMDFKKEQDKIFSQISEIRSGIRPKEILPEADLSNRLGILTGTSLWLLSNEPEINDIQSFRGKLDSFQRVLNNQSYLGMERNLCVASGVMKHLKGQWSEKDFKGFADIAEVSTDVDDKTLEMTAKKRYDEAADYFSKLIESEEVRRDANNCHFAMNFKFDGDFSIVETTYSAVSVFRDIAQELETIYEKKSQSEKSSGDIQIGVRRM